MNISYFLSFYFLNGLPRTKVWCRVSINCIFGFIFRLLPFYFYLQFVFTKFAFGDNFCVIFELSTTLKTSIMYYEWYAFVMQWFKLSLFLIYKNFNFFLGLAKTQYFSSQAEEKKKTFWKSLRENDLPFFKLFPEPYKLWRSHFQFDKVVRHFGPEAVHNYFSPVFPPVPSSSGSIISREIASFLNNDKNRFLHGFANFAQALSIWLAPIAPSYYDEDDWFNSLDEVSNFTSSKLANFGEKFVKIIWALFFSFWYWQHSRWKRYDQSLRILRGMWQNYVLKSQNDPLCMYLFLLSCEKQIPSSL